MACVYITHDLGTVMATVMATAESIAVIYRGEVGRDGAKPDVLGPLFDADTDLLLTPKRHQGWPEQAIARRTLESTGN